MKKLAVLIVLVCTIVSCNEGTKQNQRMVPKSSGNLYNVSVVVDNELWNGNVGDAIRDVLTTVVPGLPQPEPMFDINQIPPQVFSGFAAKNRIVLKIEKSDKSEIKIATDAYAQPQKVIVISGPNDTKLIEVLKDNKDKILDTFKNQEIEARQALTNNSLHTNNNIEKMLGISIKFPSIYRIAKEDGDFFWVRKNLTTGTNNFMVYQVPLDAIDKEGDITQQIITIRDSVGKKYIPGPIDGSYMKTEEAYTPFLFTTIIDNKPTYEVRSTWDIEGTYNAGPFVNYMVEDKINNRYVVLEGFTFAPSVNKRDYILELESIIKSLKIN